MDELISIIVPVYNAEKTLRRCVRSLMGQTYRNLEIILVNDGSKDGSLGLCREFAGEDARIRVIDQPNGGVSSARDIIEMMMAGATAVEVGAANLVDPYACKRIIEELPQVMAELGIRDLKEIQRV